MAEPNVSLQGNEKRRYRAEAAEIKERREVAFRLTAHSNSAHDDTGEGSDSDTMKPDSAAVPSGASVRQDNASGSGADDKSFSSDEQQSNSETTPPTLDDLEDVVGLALSGGGIRSAMFNDGFLQGLSHLTSNPSSCCD